jgi:predicted AlkP superfamily pyrophosphatase or phosphodiesterase
MNKLSFILAAFLLFNQLQAQPANRLKPKLVVGIVVDQMRWDFLYRYQNRYAAEGGFNQLLNHGLSCENAMINYTPTLTACGHASIYTGSVPAIHGITGNDWWDYALDKFVYCTADDNILSIGGSGAGAQMSPNNLLVTTIGDELKLSNSFRSKVIGIAIKDRGAILPAGHTADGAYWYDNKTGDFISSSYYMNELPNWVKELNDRKLVDKYYTQNWTTLYPLNTYTQSDLKSATFNHSLKQFAQNNYSVIAATPFGNSLSFDMAKAAITGEKMGVDTTPDLLCLSLSSPDYIGHTYGPNSVEAEDAFLRLDKDLGEFMAFLNQQVGKGEWVVFLTADHGVNQTPAFLQEHQIPAGNFDNEKLTTALNNLLKEKTKKDDLVIGIVNNQVYLDRKKYQAAGIKKETIDNLVIDFMSKQQGIFKALPLESLYAVTLPAVLKDKLANSYYASRAGDIQLILQSQWIDGFSKGGTTHGSWNPYDTHIPLLWYGSNIHPQKLYREVNITDIAPTIAALLQIQMPSGNIGHVIDELMK